jgi:hypothetical protein
VLLVSSRGAPGGHRATRAEVGLTQIAARLWGGGAALCGGIRRWWSWYGGHRQRGPSPAPGGEREREEGEVGIKRVEGARSSDLLSG